MREIVMVLSAKDAPSPIALAVVAGEARQMPFVVLTLFCHAILAFSISLGSKEGRDLE